MIKGKVHRPAYGSGDGVLTLTASVTKGTVTKTKVYNASVKEAGMTDNQVVVADKAWLDIPGKTGLKNNIVLPLVGPNGSTITWASSVEATIGTDGTVVRPSNGQQNATVKLTASITKGTVTDTKEITCTVLPWTDEEEVDIALAAINWDAIRGTNSVKTEITTDLVLSTTGERGTQVAWASSAPTVINTSGVVTRPSYTDGDRTVSLTCSVNKGTVTKTIYFMALKVIKLPITNLEAVTRAATVVDASVIKGSNIDLNNVTTDLTLPKTITDLAPECNTVSLTWKVVKADGTDDKTNPNITVIDSGNFYTAKITRPDAAGANAAVILQMMAASNASAGNEYSQNKSFNIVVLKQ
jgi:hypothetical protein